MARQSKNSSSWWTRLGWVILIWVASVATLGIFAYLMKLLMHAAGLTT